MLCTRGGMHDFVKVLDFGLVRSEERSQEDLSLTSIDSLTGTPLYISPEALEAPETVSARSDIYQLGAIAYYLLTGDHVFNGASLIEVLSKHLNKAPESPSKVLGRAVSPDLEALILATLDKDPERRPENGAAFLAALDRCKVEGVWTLVEARAWWSDYAVHLEERLQEHKSAKTGVTSALPTGWQVDLDGRQRFGSS